LSILWLTERESSGPRSLLSNPAKPWFTPNTDHPNSSDLRTTARMAAFMPGPSVPPVNTARRRIVVT
jgi:hypothetical protein